MTRSNPSGLRNHAAQRKRNRDGYQLPICPLHFGPAAQIEPDGYSIHKINGLTVITGSTDRGVLYGAFAYLRDGGIDEKSNPSAPIRWVNQWDNLDGTIERGYGGRSIFWENGHVRADLTRVSDYGRFLASIGINGATIDNVNVPTNASPFRRIHSLKSLESRSGVSSLGSEDRCLRGFRQSPDARGARHLRSPRPEGCRTESGRQRAEQSSTKLSPTLSNT